jgi:hypothetical protein
MLHIASLSNLATTIVSYIIDIHCATNTVGFIYWVPYLGQYIVGNIPGVNCQDRLEHAARLSKLP